ncbi:MAG: hypothetical protein WBQ10_07630 [Terriglobales bacterium]
MKKLRQPRKTSCDLPDSVNRRLNMYALAASAAGVGFIASTQSTEAKIIYTPAHVTIRLHDSYKLDLNHDGIADFTILNTSYHNTSTWFYRLSEKAAQGNGVEASNSHTFQQELAEALRRGARIPGSHAFYHKPALLASAVYNPGGTFSGGNWVNVSGRYLGLRFKLKGQPHYGWVRLTVQVSGTRVTLELRQFLTHQPVHACSIAVALGMGKMREHFRYRKAVGRGLPFGIFDRQVAHQSAQDRGGRLQLVEAV